MGNVLLTADSGSTKTTWVGQANGHEMFRHQTPGINPFMLDEAAIKDLLRNDAPLSALAPQVADIRFFGAGCRGAQCDVVRKALQKVFAEAQTIVVDSDLAGAAHALLPDGTGIACIMGTGSNSGLFLRGKMVHNVSPLGYVLGDEGSGAVLGRLLVGDVLKHQLPEEICTDFFATYSLTPDEVVRRVYREPMPNRFLASFAPFLHRHRSHPAVHALLLHEFRRFFLRNVAAYGRPDLPIGLVGSIAFFFRDEIAEAAAGCGMTIGKVLREPL